MLVSFTQSQIRVPNMQSPGAGVQASPVVGSADGHITSTVLQNHSVVPKATLVSHVHALEAYAHSRLVTVQAAPSVGASPGQSAGFPLPP
jgi:hypothetical protein